MAKGSPFTMNKGAFESWLDAYGHAWETRDSQAAAALFTEDATYQETPFSTPMRGRSAIHQYWSDATGSQDQIGFGYDVLAVTSDLGIARWWASFADIQSQAQVKLDGIFVIAMGADNRCRDLREWWHTQVKGS